jgi:hypothetical protein
VAAGDPRVLDPRFVADQRGQWATRAAASSQYGTTGYSAGQACGVPDVPGCGDSDKAWTPSQSQRGVETLTLDFARPVHATEVRVRQSLNPGAITRIEVASATAGRQVVFQGPDLTTYPASTVGWLVVEFAATKFAATTVTVTLDTTKVSGWKEIDAVQLVGDPPEVR